MPKPYKSRGVAIVLALFLGGFGAHKFYLNRVGWGFIYLLFCWTGIPVIVALFELLAYSCYTKENWDKKYNLDSASNNVKIRLFKIWSIEHQAWWSSGSRGYTEKRSDAGLYVFEQALKIVEEANIGLNNIPNEAMVEALSVETCGF